VYLCLCVCVGVCVCGGNLEVRPRGLNSYGVRVVRVMEYTQGKDRNSISPLSGALSP
jgi:hypothetical protein